MGFCLLNNAALAAAHARALGAERVLVLDWDVHHGNGTQEAFYADPSVLFVSLHQSPYYPGSGSELEAGDGEGRGFTVNLPLTAGAGNAVYFAAFERIVLPIIAQYRPELTLISAGFDAHGRDPLGGMQLTDAAYFRLTRELMRTLGPEAPIGVLTEGGYDLAALEGSLWSTLQALARAELAMPPEPELTASQDREIQRLETAAGAYWRLE
jgi:acetoin utilization deacetylase AcuC-like enzyme